MMVTCVYHKADLDGQCSAAIIALEHPDCFLVPMQYGDSLDLLTSLTEGCVEGDMIYIVDFNLPIQVCREYISRGIDVIWVDHHKTAIDAAEKEGFNPRGLRRIGDAACVLTWEYFNGAEPPRVVRLLGEYDVRRLTDEVIALQYGMRQQGFTANPKDPLWEELLKEMLPLDAIMAEGRSIYQYITTENARHAKTKCFTAVIDGLVWLCANHGPANSQFFDSIYDPRKHDLMCKFYLNSACRWLFSLYSTKPEIDVSEIAKRYGGGGHRGAAGFTSDDIDMIMMASPA